MKDQIYQQCMDFVGAKILACQENIQSAQETSNADTKSSAGDKYETTRAMMQIEIENNTKRLAEAQDLQKILLQLTFQEKYEAVALGSLVHTNQGTFFIAIGMGQLKIGTQTYFVISPALAYWGFAYEKESERFVHFLA